MLKTLLEEGITDEEFAGSKGPLVTKVRGNIFSCFFFLRRVDGATGRLLQWFVRRSRSCRCPSAPGEGFPRFNAFTLRTWVNVSRLSPPGFHSLFFLPNRFVRPRSRTCSGCSSWRIWGMMSHPSRLIASVRSWARARVCGGCGEVCEGGGLDHADVRAFLGGGRGGRGVVVGVGCVGLCGFEAVSVCERVLDRKPVCYNPHATPHLQRALDTIHLTPFTPHPTPAQTRLEPKLHKPDLHPPLFLLLIPTSTPPPPPPPPPLSS